MLVISEGVEAANHHWDSIHVLKTCGYLCHLAFEVIVMKMEMRHWKGHIEASRTIILDYSHSLAEDSRRLMIEIDDKKDSDGIIDVAREFSVGSA